MSGLVNEISAGVQRVGATWAALGAAAAATLITWQNFVRMQDTAVVPGTAGGIVIEKATVHVDATVGDGNDGVPRADVGKHK